ncbi:hypothetical protein [Halovenus marina]|uniref:hypothetical protein n=1 Tax=Halovenus marina TaxID=3396621 RepID=UPI003F56EC4F
MEETTTVAFRVDASVKEEWEEAAEGPEYDSLSHLIRLSVQREITDAERADNPPQAENNLDSNGEVMKSITRIERSMERLSDEVEAIGRENRDEELYDLEQVLLEILPEYNPSKHDLENPIEADIEALTAEEAAAKIGADEEKVSNALLRLSENTGQVKRLDPGPDSVSESPSRYTKVK